MLVLSQTRGENLRWESLGRSQIIDRATLGWLGYHRNEHKWGPHGGLVFSEDGATASRMLFRWVLGLSDVKFGPFWIKIGPSGVDNPDFPYFLIEVALSIFL